MCYNANYKINLLFKLINSFIFIYLLLTNKEITQIITQNNLAKLIVLRKNFKLKYIIILNNVYYFQVLKKNVIKNNLNLISLLHNISGLGVFPFLYSFKKFLNTCSQYS